MMPAQRSHAEALARLRRAVETVTEHSVPPAAVLIEVETALRDLRRRPATGHDAAGTLNARQALGATIESRTAPHLSAAVIRAAPTPGEPITDDARSGVFIDLCRCLTSLCAGGHALVGRPVAAGAVTAAADSLAHRVRFYQQESIRRLEGGDSPDLRGIGSNLFRIDVLSWGLEILQAESAVAAVRTHSGVLARAAVRRAITVADSYVRHRDIDNRFTLAETLRDVQELIDVARRASAHRDSLRAEALSAGSAVFEDCDVVARLLETVAPLSRAVLEDMRDRTIAGALSATSATGTLRQVEAILTFCRNTHHGAAPAALHDAATICTHLLAECADALARQYNAPATGETSRVRLKALLKAMEDGTARLQTLVTPARVK